MEAGEERARLERLAALGARVAEVSHELRNALSVLETSLHLVRRALAESPDLPRVEAQFERMARQIHAGQRIVRESLADARGGERGRVEVRGLLLEVLAGLARPEQVAIEVEAEATDAVVDEDSMRQVLLNLLRNAVEAIGEGPGTIHVRLSAVEAEIAIEVRDDGPGIAAAVRDHLFEAFVTGKPNGTGLGLSLSQRLAASQGGRIEVADVTPHGTAFTVVVPRTGVGGVSGT